ncbi:MAG: hypothetical protein JWP10_1294 [Nocardioidaceae bacterium]|nr:hypothetical protein [Nocardioidaceae bacterium]
MRTVLSKKNKIGIVIAAVIAVPDLLSVVSPPTPDGETGPPIGILIVSSILAVITLVAVYFAWRGNAAALRVVAGTRVLGVLTSLPAFFVDVPAGLKVAVAVYVVLTIAALILMFSPAKQPADVSV